MSKDEESKNQCKQNDGVKILLCVCIAIFSICAILLLLKSVSALELSDSSNWFEKVFLVKCNEAEKIFFIMATVFFGFFVTCLSFILREISIRSSKINCLTDQYNSLKQKTVTKKETSRDEIKETVIKKIVPTKDLFKYYASSLTEI